MRGGVGELVVEGPLVGRGYHGREDLTMKVFAEWPEKGRWSYRTGDLVREYQFYSALVVPTHDNGLKV